jgi:hypothetical protein
VHDVSAKLGRMSWSFVGTMIEAPYVVDAFPFRFRVEPLDVHNL